jgi:hypothetical protein
MAIATEASASELGQIPPLHATHTPDAIRAGLIGFGLYELARGIAPAGPCPGGELERAERATFDLPLGFALLAAVRRRSWRSPLLALGSLSWAVRALRLVNGDTRSARRWPERVERAKLTLGAGALGWLFSRASRAERWAAR